MEFYSAVYARRTIRDFTDEPVDPEVLRRILAAGLRAPSNDHLRKWEFVVVTDHALIDQLLKKIPKSVSEKRLNFILNSMCLKSEEQQKMYQEAIPLQRKMLSTSGCLVLPLFYQKSDLLAPKNINALNGFASIWCCIENMLLACTAENLGCALRIPMGDEAAHVAEVLSLPKGYTLPCFLAIGHPADTAPLPQQLPFDLESRLHFNQW